MLRGAFYVALTLVAALAVYATVAYRAYNAPQPAQRPCRECATPVSVNGYQLYYREVGTDSTHTPVIIVHGGPGHSALSFKQSFDFLAADRRVAYYDQRGSGYSESKARIADYHIDSLVEELEALRRDVVRADNVALVGHSFGSALVQRYAMRYGAHVERLVIVGGIRLNNGMTNYAVWKWLGPALYSTAMGFPKGTGDAADAWFTGSGESDAYLRLSDTTQRALLDGTGVMSFAAWKAISLSLVGDAQEESLRRVEAPTLIAWGAADSPYTGRETAEAMCGVLPTCTTVGFAHSGHWPFLEEPERFQAVVGGFVRGEPSGAASTN
jgi:proline iminopeptidase